MRSYLENRIEYNTLLIENLKRSSDLNKVCEKLKELEIFVSKCKELLNEL